jgi:hypothetical protein
LLPSTHRVCRRSPLQSPPLPPCCPVHPPGSSPVTLATAHPPPAVGGPCDADTSM